MLSCRHCVCSAVGTTWCNFFTCSRLVTMQFFLHWVGAAETLWWGEKFPAQPGSEPVPEGAAMPLRNLKLVGIEGAHCTSGLILQMCGHPS